MGEVAERGPRKQRKLTPADQRNLQRELAMNEHTRSELARAYGVSAAYITQFARQYHNQIEAIRANLDDKFAGLWIASKEQRVAAYEHEFQQSADSEYSGHYEHVRTRATILRNVAEELGELPNRSTAAIIIPVEHVVVGVELDALKLLKTGLQAGICTPQSGHSHATVSPVTSRSTGSAARCGQGPSAAARSVKSRRYSGPCAMSRARSIRTGAPLVRAARPRRPACRGSRR